MTDPDSQRTAPRPLFSPSSRLGRFVQVALVVVPAGFFVAGIVVAEHTRVYKIDDVARRLRVERGAGDLIVLAGGLPSAQPFARIPNVFSASDKLPAAWFRRIFVVSSEGASPITRVGALTLPPATQTRKLGVFRISEHVLAKTSLFDAIHGATVRFVHKNGRIDVCRGMRTGQFECPKEGWLQVHLGALTVHGRAIECITAHPADDGALQIEFPELTLGTLLSLRTALADSASPPPVHVEVGALGRVIGAFEHRAIPGWEAHDLPTGDLAGRTTRLTVVLTVPTGGRSHFCFAGGT